MIQNKAVYNFAEERLESGGWVPNGNTGQMELGGYGSGVGLVHYQNHTYVLTANHVVEPMEENITLMHRSMLLRRILTRAYEDTGIITSYERDEENNMNFKTVPLELVAARPEYDLALVRTPERTELNTVNRLGSVSEGDIVFGVGFRILPATTGIASSFSKSSL